MATYNSAGLTGTATQPVLNNMFPQGQQMMYPMGVGVPLSGGIPQPMYGQPIMGNPIVGQPMVGQPIIGQPGIGFQQPMYVSPQPFIRPGYPL